jgi:hypothetical protein
MTNPTPPRGLEVISKASGDSDIPDTERRRLPRISLMGEQFKLDTAGKVFSVTDLSLEGMALRIIDRDHFKYFVTGTLLQGHLNLKGDKYSIDARVKRLSHDAVGFQFENLSENLRKALSKFLDPKILGAELRPIPSSEGGPIWYHAPSGTDLLLWRKTDGQYRRISLFVLGTFIQWDETDGLTTGRTDTQDSPSESWGVVHFETMLLRHDLKVDQSKLQIAKTLVMSSNLPQDLKKWATRQFAAH